MAKIVKAAAGYMAASAPSPLDRLMEAKAVAEPVFKGKPEIEDAELEGMAEALKGKVTLRQKDGVLYIGTVADAKSREELTSVQKIQLSPSLSQNLLSLYPLNTSNNYLMIFKLFY